MNASDPNFVSLIKVAARDLLDEELGLFHSIDTSKTKMSDKAIRRIRRKIRNYDKDSWWSSVPLACRRAVAAVLVICSISFVFCMSATAVRVEIINTVMKWHNDFVSLFYVTEQIPPSVIEKYREPMLQLAGTERQVIAQETTDYIVIYTKDNGQSISYQQMIIGNSTDLDAEDCVLTRIKINDNEAQLFTYDDGVRIITWQDNEYAYILSVDPMDIAIDALIDIAESVK